MADKALLIQSLQSMIASIDNLDAKGVGDLVNTSGAALPEAKKYLAELARRRLAEIHSVRTIANYEMERLADAADRDTVISGDGVVWLQRVAIELSEQLTSVIHEFNRSQGGTPEAN